MKEAVVIHPRLTVYGGAEILALHVVKSLQDRDFLVSLVCDNFNPEEVERNFGMGKVLRACRPIIVPRFKPLLPRLLTAQKMRYAHNLMKMLKTLRPDVAFSTQSALYFIPDIPTYHILYDLVDLLEILPGGRLRGPLASLWKKPYYDFLKRYLNPDFTANRVFIPLSGALEKDVRKLGYSHTGVVFPPCDMIFKPRQKKKQVCVVTRIAPQKNVEDFIRVASRLVDYKFVLVGTHSDVNSAYTHRVLSAASRNVEFIDARIRDRPELVEESKVYLYTSLEPGVGIALGQAFGAGCIPVTPAWGGGAEMVKATGVGFTFKTLEEAERVTLEALECENERYKPDYIASKAVIFSSETFEKQIARIAIEKPAMSLS